MGLALAQVRLARDNGLPEDVVINTFHFSTSTIGSVSAVEATEITDRLTSFYNDLATGATVIVRTMLSSVLAAVGHEIRVYDLEQPEPRAPIRTQAMAMTPGSGAMPSEVALCLSYRGALVSGLNPRRRRGRIYLGPLTIGIASVTDTADVRPDIGYRQSLLAAADTILQREEDGVFWVVASQPVEGGPISTTPVTFMWVDNAFDTQRRRGADPTSRVSVGT